MFKVSDICYLRFPVFAFPFVKQLIVHNVGVCRIIRLSVTAAVLACALLRSFRGS
jgi:hypothetical protein